MKDAIAKFITNHPFLTYWLAGALLTTVKVIFRGYPERESLKTTEGEKISVNKSDLEEVEIVEEDKHETKEEARL